VSQIASGVLGAAAVPAGRASALGRTCEGLGIRGSAAILPGAGFGYRWSPGPGNVGHLGTASVHLYDINWPLICYFMIQFLFTWCA
jgi:hypothetical protein